MVITQRWDTDVGMCDHLLFTLFSQCEYGMTRDEAQMSGLLISGILSLSLFGYVCRSETTNRSSTMWVVGPRIRYRLSGFVARVFILAWPIWNGLLDVLGSCVPQVFETQEHEILCLGDISFSHFQEETVPVNSLFQPLASP